MVVFAMYYNDVGISVLGMWYVSVITIRLSVLCRYYSRGCWRSNEDLSTLVVYSELTLVNIRFGIE